jgi:FtsH-binding integral membrane protein
MQETPQMMTGPGMSRPAVEMLLSLFFVVGLGFLAAGGIVWNYANLGPTMDPGQEDMQQVHAPILWNAGFFFLLTSIFGAAVFRKDMDPMGRLLLWLVSLILVLLLFTAPGLWFSAP